MNKRILSLFLLGGVLFVKAQTGKVGINTENPTETLQVKGTFRVSELPDANAQNSIYTQVNGGNSDTKTQTFTPAKMVVVDNNGVFGKQDILTIPSYTGSTSVVLENNSFKRAALTGDVVSVIDSNNVTVTKLQGNAVSITAPTQGQILKWNGTQWTPTNEVVNTNIYNANGTIDANRTVTMSGRTLDFTGGKTSFINNQETISLKSATAGQSTYMGFYKNDATTRNAYLGFPSSGNNNFSIKNEISGGIVNIENNTEVGGTLKVTNIPTGATTDAIVVADTSGNIKKVSASTIKDDINRVSLDVVAHGATKDLSALAASDFKDLYVVDNGTVILPSCTSNYEGKMVSFYKWGGRGGSVTLKTNSTTGNIHNASTTDGFSFPTGVSYSNNSLILNNTEISSVGFRLIRLICISGNWFPDYGFR